MIFFFFSFLASVFGTIKARGFSFSGISLNLELSVNNPFSGIIAFWPFIVILVLLLLAILWYQTIKNIRSSKTRATRKPRGGIQNTTFLGIVTVLVLILMAAPWYLESFSSLEKEQSVSAEDRTEIVLTVHGMDCGGCEGLVNRRVGIIDGVEEVTASHVNEEVVVIYDKSKVSLTLIAQTIEDSGYTVILE